jgi:hypothetical protein
MTASSGPRDHSQSRRLHEPSQRLSTTDPVTGRDTEDPEGHPYLVDGNLTIPFESEDNRPALAAIPKDHSPRLADNPIDEAFDEG